MKGKKTATERDPLTVEAAMNYAVQMTTEQAQAHVAAYGDHLPNKPFSLAVFDTAKEIAAKGEINE